MKKYKRPLLALIGILIAAGGAFVPRVTLLCLENLDHPKSICIRVGPSRSFSLFYIHSIYRVPAVEEFRITQDTIFLTGVKTRSPAVMEYYGFDEVKEFHPMNKRLGTAFSVKRGMGQSQALMVGDRKIELGEVGEKGDRIGIRARSFSWGGYVIRRILRPSYH